MMCYRRAVMRPFSYSIFFAATLSLVSVGASCGDDSSSTEIVPEPSESAGGDSASVDLPGVDLSELTRTEQRLFRTVVDDTLSPCGEPVSLAECVSEGRDCAKCRPAAKFVHRLIVEGYGAAEIEEQLSLRYGPDTRLEIPVGDAPVRGSPMAPITITEFSDFECPYCGEAHPMLQEVLRQYEGKVRLIFMHYPLDGHPHAAAAARAAVAAQNQGRFWEMTDKLFENQHALEQEHLERYAADLGLDVDRFRADLIAEETQARIDANKALGQQLGVAGTPTFFINSRRFRQSPESLVAYLEEELEATR